MTGRRTAARKLLSLLVGLGNGALAGGVVAWITLTFYCYLTMGQDCSDGYIAMVLLGPIGMVVGAIVGGIAATRSRPLI